MKNLLRVSALLIIMIVMYWNDACFGIVPAFLNKTGESKEQYFYVRENRVILRIFPGNRARAIASIDSGAICNGIYHIGEWVQVKFENGREGFIHQSLLSPYSPGSGIYLQSDQNLITNLIDDSINVVLAEQSKKIKETSSKMTVWMRIAIFSLMVNVVLVVLVLKKIFEKKKAIKEYVDFKELATIQKSRETLQEEVDLLRRTNKNLEKKILQLEEKLNKE